jgi:(5-formylfuran-3-yl)methyl phosphate synthase
MQLFNLIKFILLASEQKLLCGLAGSLCIDDIEELNYLKPDYLGFRGALCEGRVREKIISAKMLNLLQNVLLNKLQPKFNFGHDAAKIIM